MTVFTVGYQEVRVWQDKGRWVVAVDADIHRGGFMSEAQAAGAGLLRAQRNVRIAEAGTHPSRVSSFPAIR